MKKFSEPTIKIDYFRTENIITTSGTGDSQAKPVEGTSTTETTARNFTVDFSNAKWTL